MWTTVIARMAIAPTPKEASAVAVLPDMMAMVSTASVSVCMCRHTQGHVPDVKIQNMRILLILSVSTI